MSKKYNIDDVNNISKKKMPIDSIELVEKLIQELGLQHTIKNYVISKKLWNNITDEKDEYSEEDKDFCTLKNIKYFQQLLLQQSLSNTQSEKN